MSQNLDRYKSYKDDKKLTIGTLRDVSNVLGVTDRMVSKYLEDEKNPIPLYIKSHRGKGDEFIKSNLFSMHDVFQWALDRQMRDSYRDEDSEETYNPKREQARLHKEKADSEAIKNSILRKEYAPVKVLEDSLGNIAGQVSSILGALPMLLKRRYAWLTGKQITLIQKEITRIQNVVSTVRVDVDLSYDE